MKHKLIAYTILPVVGLSLLGANMASAHGLFGFGNVTPEEIANRQQMMFQHEADVLGISIDEVKNAWAEGKTIQQIIDEKGLNKDQIQQRMKDLQAEKMKAHLEALVDKGIITQAQADKRLDLMKSRMEKGKGRMGKVFHGGMLW